MVYNKHKDFPVAVLLKNVLWAALVGLHDRESRSRLPRDSIPFKGFKGFNFLSKFVILQQ